MKIPFLKYVRISSKLKTPRFKLVNSNLKDGMVEISESDFADLIAESCHHDSYVREDVDYGEVEKKAFPPCIANIVTRASYGINLEHAERFTLATFLLKIGATEEQVAELFTRQPDYDEGYTLYQIDQISRKGYTPPSCSHLSTIGLCMKEASCEGGHPLRYYLNNAKSNGTIINTIL